MRDVDIKYLKLYLSIMQITLKDRAIGLAKYKKE